MWATATITAVSLSLFSFAFLYVGDIMGGIKGGTLSGGPS
jgi:hypothetical protein